MERNPDNAVVLFKMIEKGRTARHGDLVLRTLDRLCRLHPESADAAAAYCWAYKQHVDTAFVKGGDYRARRPEEVRLYETWFRRAKQLGRQNWLVTLVDGYQAYVSEAENFGLALPLLEQAIRLAPKDKYIRAQCWVYYGAALNLAAMRKFVYREQAVTFQQSAQALETSAKIDPRLNGTWLTLFSIYNAELKDRNNALRAKRGFLRALPPARQKTLSKWIKGSLARYPA